MPYLDLDEEEKIEEKSIGVQNGAVNKLIVEIQQHTNKADSSDDSPLKNSTPTSLRSRALDISQSLATTLFNTAKICVFALFLISIVLILIKISAQEGTVILPFEVSGDKNLSGIAIADQLAAELTQIQKIHSIKNESITLRTNSSFSTYGFSPESSLGKREMVVPKAETVEFGMGEIGSIDAGSGSLSIGRLIIAFQNLLPGPKSITTIRGSLQRYESSIVLIGLLEGDKVQSWIIRQPSGNNEDQPEEMIRSLAFMIALDLQQTDVSAKTWQGLKWYTAALDAYHQYQMTGNSSFLYLAGNSSLDAIRFEKGYQRTYDLLASMESLCIMAGRQNDALEYCNKTIELDPLHPSGWFNKGAVLINLDKYDDAIEAFDEAIKLDPKYADAWISKGNSLYGQDKYDEAIEAYDEAIKLDPKLAYAWYSKGNSLYRQGKYDEAIEAYDEAIKLDPKSAIAWKGKGYASIAKANTTKPSRPMMKPSS